MDSTSNGTVHAATYTSWQSPGFFATDIDDLQIINCESFLSYGQGINLEDVTNSLFLNNEIYNNNQGLVSTNGFRMVGTSTHNHIIGNRSYDDQGSPTQVYGFSEGGSCDYNFWSNNEAYGNTTAAFFATKHS